MDFGDHSSIILPADGLQGTAARPASFTAAARMKDPNLCKQDIYLQQLTQTNHRKEGMYDTPDRCSRYGIMEF
jgi:hypothetical protein